jgi:hypothetical protein
MNKLINIIKIQIFVSLSLDLNAQGGYFLQLLPNQRFESASYSFVNRTQAGTLEKVTFKLLDTAKWILKWEPKITQTTWCLDPSRRDYSIQSPTALGFYNANFAVDASQSRSGIVLQDFTVTLQVTNTPTPNDTITIEAKPNELVSVNRKIKADLRFAYTGICTGFTYDINAPSQKHKVFLRDSTVSWIKIDRDTFTLLKGDSINLNLDFKSLTIGQFQTYLVTYREHRGYPIYTLIRFNVKTATQTYDILENEAVSVFPNPTDNNITIEAKEGQLLALIITDISGKTISRVIPNSTLFTIDLHEKGVYFAKIKTGKGWSSRKIVKF